MAQELALKGIQISSTGVRGVWMRHGLLSKHEHLLRLHRTLLNEHFRIAGRTKWYETIEEMQKDLDAYLVQYNSKRPHQRRMMNSKPPAEMFLKGLPKTKKPAEEPVAEAA